MSRFDLVVGICLGWWLSLCVFVAFHSYHNVRLAHVQWAAYTMYFGTMLTALPIIPRMLCVTIEQHVHAVDGVVIIVAIALAVALIYTDIDYRNALVILAMLNVVFVVGSLLCVAKHKATDMRMPIVYVDTSSDDEI